MPRPFVEDLGPSPFGHLGTPNRPKFEPGRSINQSGRFKQHFHHYNGPSIDVPRATNPGSLQQAKSAALLLAETSPTTRADSTPRETLKIQNPSSNRDQEDMSLPASSMKIAIPRSRRNRPPRNLISWDGQDLDVGPFRGQRRFQAVINATSKTCSPLEKISRVENPMQPRHATVPTAHRLSSPPVNQVSLDPVNTRASLQHSLEAGLDELSLKDDSRDYWSSQLRSRQLPITKTSTISCNMKKPITPQPFLDTNFGRVPPEVRAVIWGHVFVAPEPWVLVRYPDSRHQSPPTQMEVGPANSTDDSSDPSFLRRIDILRTCRTIYQEGRHVLYSKNSFYFQSGSDCSKFLVSIGHEYVGKLKSLQFAGLVYYKSLTKEKVDELFPEERFSSDYRARILKLPRPYLYEDTEEAARLLRKCEGLTNVSLWMQVGEEEAIIDFLRHIRWWKTYVDFIDSFHWKLRPEKPEERYSHCNSWDARPTAGDWGDLTWGNDRVVTVEIAPQGKPGINQIIDDSQGFF
ncbi:hypothetical protein ACLMJK_008129 [Lecanora helva]